MNTNVLLMPRDPALPVRCLAIDAAGLVAQVLELPAGAMLPAAFTDAATHTILVVPGSEVGACWTGLPARNPVQALAAARLLLADRVAEPVEGLHIALGALHPRQPRLLCWVKPAQLRLWLERAARLGSQVDAVVPDYLALPEVPDRILAAEWEGAWLVRGQGLAFAAEPALALQVLGGREFQSMPAGALEAALAAGALQAPLDLLQYEFAPARARDPGDPPRRRLLVLAALVLASPPVLLLADALRYQVATHSLLAQADAIAAPYLPHGSQGNAAARLAQVVAAREAPARAHAVRQSLFEAVAATPGTRLESLRFDLANGLHATVVHATAPQLQQLLEALGARGASAAAAPLEAGPDGLRARLDLAPVP